MKLHDAAAKNDVKKLQELLDAGMPVDKRDPSGDTALLVAAQEGKEKAFFLLLDAGADPKAVGDNGESVLHRAASIGKIKMVQALLERGADVNLLCHYPQEDWDLHPGLTPLHCALFNYRYNIAELLLQHGADINAKLEDGRTALDLVEDLEDRALSKWLREHGAIPDPAREALKGPVTELHKAARKGDLKKIRQCLADGQPVDARDPEGEPPLMNAARKNKPEAFAELLQAKADPNAVDRQGQSVFAHVMSTGVPAMVRAWIAAGGNVNQPAHVRSRLTPLMLAVLGRNEEAVRMLLVAGADVRAKDAEGHTVQRWAKTLATPEIAEMIKQVREGHAVTATPDAAQMTPEGFLRAVTREDMAAIGAWIAAGKPVDVRDQDGLTALALAGKAEKWQAFHALLAAGADPNALDASEFSVLFWAAPNEKAVRELIKAGADVNYQTPRQRFTPLMRACHVNQPNAAKAMIEAGADVTAKDWEGRNALDRAKENRNQKLGSYLREQMAAAKKQPQPLHRQLSQAVVEGKADRIKELIQAGAAVDHQESSGHTPLMLACLHRRQSAFEALLEAGADPHAVGPQGDTVLFFAAQSGEPPLVQALLQKGVDVNFQRLEPNDAGHTALMGAAEGGDKKIVQWLLDAGANPLTKDRDGKTAYDHAREVLENDIAKLLKQRMKALQPPPESPKAEKQPDETKPAQQEGLPYKEIRALVKGFPEAAAQPAFQQLLQRVTELYGQEPEPWREDSGIYRLRLKKRNLAALAAKFQMEPLTDDEDQEAEDYQRLGQLIARLQEEVRKAGFLLVQTDLLGGKTASLRLFPTDNPYAVISATGTNGNRILEVKDRQEFLGPKQIARWLHRMTREQPFVLTQCGKDFVGGDFLQPVTDVKKLARRMYNFCPDIVEQGTGTVAKLAEEVKENQSFYLWWD